MPGESGEKDLGVRNGRAGLAAGPDRLARAHAPILRVGCKIKKYGVPQRYSRIFLKPQQLSSCFPPGVS